MSRALALDQHAAGRHRLRLLIQLLSNSRLTDSVQLVAHGRELAHDLDLPLNPVGVSNKKTGTPGTYRPVGLSCPPCPVAAECYALGRPTTYHQERATTSRLASVTSAAIAMTIAQRQGTLARLHIAGDFFDGGVLDVGYIDELAELGALIRECFDTQGPVAWSYTHTAPELFEPYRLLLEDGGVVVLYSGSPAPGGALIWPHDLMDELREAHPERQFIRCPAQVRKATCRDCGLCWQARGRGLCIVFDPHGAKAAGLRRRLLDGGPPTT